MKNWKSKVASDVRNIATTDRGYSRIFFITNQFAPDKSRAQSEDSLTKETGIKVTILDRSWIIKAVIENGRADIAIDALNIEELRPLVERKIGPSDVERQRELEELERAITDPDHYQGARYQLIEDALRAALLARGLGRPRTEIDGLFLRADRLASNPEQPRQRLRIAYNYAWSAIFWLDDYRLLNSLYETVEGYALKSDQMEEVELVQNLWVVLLSQVRRGVLSRTDARLESRKEALSAVLKRLAADTTRPNNALRAKTGLTVLAAQEALQSKDDSALTDVWKAFTEIVTEAEGLGDYPFERLAKLVEVFGQIGVESDGFDALFESVVTALEKRRGEAAGAGLLRDRGFQKLEANRPYEAISLLGRALERFVKREHRDDLIFCMMGLSEAYVMVGLLWAARSCALSAAERCLAYYREEGKLVRFSLSTIEQLILIEMRLGRLAHVLLAVELENVLAQQMTLTEDRRASLAEHRQVTEGMLGIALLSSSIDQLRDMGGLPEVLEELGLFIPKAFLLYALGYRDELRNEGFTADKWSDDDIDEFMKKALGQPGRLQMPPRPQIEAGQTVVYRTAVLGCQITLEAPATRDGISVAEAVLGTIEAFFATSLNQRVMPYRPTAKIEVAPSSDLPEGLLVTEENPAGEALIRVQYPAVNPAFSAESRRKYREGLRILISRFIVHTVVIDDIASYLTRIADEERGFSRALLYSEASLAQDNLFGPSANVLLRDWTPREGATRFPLRRTAEWYRGLAITQIPLSEDEKQPEPDPNDPSAFFKQKLLSEKHSDRKVASEINIPLWNEAGWRAVFYLFDPRVAPYPLLCFGFKNKDAGERIFQGWRKQLGSEDKGNKLRITILRGIQRDNPAAYRVFVGTNINPGENSNSIVMMVGRHHTMAPTTTRNLDGFLEIIGQSGKYLLAPAHFVSEAAFPDIGLGFTILKKQLAVRNAWEVSRNDVDAAAFAADDDPVIPPDVQNPPVAALLEMIRKFSKQNGDPPSGKG